MQKSCKKCTQPFEITDEDVAFYEKISPTFANKKYPVPAPTFCPDCRRQRRLAFRNQHKLYLRPCDLCKKQIVSMYAVDIPHRVYCADCWWSDKWDGLDFGREFDFEKPFFEQFNELKLKVPHFALHATHNENSDYVTLSGYNKNCYLISAAEYNEDCLYGSWVINSQDCIDTLKCLDSKFCYEVVDVEKCYQLFFSRNCKSCNNSMFLYDCRGCSDCLFSVNLRNKQYYIFNKPYSKGEYEKQKAEILEQIKAGKLGELFKTFNEIAQKAMHKAIDIVNCENCTGDYLSDSKNLTFCFDMAHAQDCRYCNTCYNVKDISDLSHATDIELAHEGVSIGYKSYNVHFGVGSWTSSNLFYTDNIHTSSDLFGCIGLKQKKYCILNKQYTQEEYEKLVPKIIEHMIASGAWGEFFPISISPFAYNESVANEYFPLTKQQAIQLGSHWKEEENPAQQNATTSQEVLQCKQCAHLYKIVPAELKFYQKMQLPLPQFCPDCRFKTRFAFRNPRKLWNRECSKCNAPIQTSYAPERSARSPSEGLGPAPTGKQIYCDKCYLEAVY